MRFLIIISILSFLIFSCGDKVEKKTTEQHDKKDIQEELNYKKDGKYISYYENGNIKHEMNFKNGNIIGGWAAYLKMVKLITKEFI